MAINFPASPSVNDTYTVNSVVYTWDGTKWNASTGFVSYSYADKIQEGDSTAEVVDNGSDAYFTVTNNAVEKFRVNVDGQLSTPYAGNASSPALYVGGDINSGLYSPGADQLALATNGTGRLFVDASGRVLIGTQTNNGFKFKVSDNGGAEFALLPNDGGVNNISCYDRSALAYVPLLVNALDHRIYVSGSEKLRITSAGKVGIGTSSPTVKLEVNGGTDNEPIKVVSTDAGSYIAFADNGTTGSTRLGAVSDDFKIDVNSSEIVRITSSGRVGIGTMSPTQALDVSGSIVASGRLLVGSSGTAAAPAFSFSGDDDGGMFRPSVNTIAFSTLGAEAFRVDNAQRLLVGTASGVQGRQLQVNGGGVGVGGAFSFQKYVSGVAHNTSTEILRASGFTVNSNGASVYRISVMATFAGAATRFKEYIWIPTIFQSSVVSILNELTDSASFLNINAGVRAIEFTVASARVDNDYTLNITISATGSSGGFASEVMVFAQAIGGRYSAVYPNAHPLS